VSIENPALSTTLTSRIIGTNMIRKGGFEKGMPCNYTIWTTDPAPSIAFGVEDSTLKGTATIEI
jgi:hypothetical protein